MCVVLVVISWYKWGTWAPAHIHVRFGSSQVWRSFQGQGQGQVLSLYMCSSVLMLLVRNTMGELPIWYLITCHFDSRPWYTHKILSFCLYSELTYPMFLVPASCTLCFIHNRIVHTITSTHYTYPVSQETALNPVDIPGPVMMANWHVWHEENDISRV